MVVALECNWLSASARILPERDDARWRLLVRPAP